MAGGLKSQKAMSAFGVKRTKPGVWPSTACPLMIWHKADNAEPLASQEMERLK